MCKTYYLGGDMDVSLSYKKSYIIVSLLFKWVALGINKTQIYYVVSNFKIYKTMNL